MNEEIVKEGRKEGKGMRERIETKEENEKREIVHEGKERRRKK